MKNGDTESEAILSGIDLNENMKLSASKVYGGDAIIKKFVFAF